MKLHILLQGCTEQLYKEIQATNKIGMFAMGCYVVIQFELIYNCALNATNTQTSIPLG